MQASYPNPTQWAASDHTVVGPMGIDTRLCRCHDDVGDKQPVQERNRYPATTCIESLK